MILKSLSKFIRMIIPISYLLSLLFTTAILPICSSVQVSPFSYSIFTPSRMYRIAYSTDLSGSSNSYVINYPASPWTSTPTVIFSIVGASFDNGIDFELTVPQKNTTALKANIVFTSTMSSIHFLFLVMDSDLYPSSVSQFTYTMPLGATGLQSFVITGIQSHGVSFLTELRTELGSLPSGFAPNALSLVTPSVGYLNIVQTNLTIVYNTVQLSIKHFKVMFYDFDKDNFRAVDNDRSGQKFELYGTSGLSTNIYSTSSYMSIYKNNYVTGLQTIYDGQFLFGPLSFDITTSFTTKVYYFSSEILFASYYCPTRYPVTDPSRTNCYSSCEDGQYADAQWMCQPCDSNCLKCTITSTRCTACKYPWVLQNGYLCGCPKNKLEIILANGTLQCQLCSDFMFGCSSCSSTTTCLDCMTNLKLEPPATCYCYNGTQLKTIQGRPYCVSTNLRIQEQCDDNFYQVNTTCLCTSYYNLTLQKGKCKPKP